MIYTITFNILNIIYNISKIKATKSALLEKFLYYCSVNTQRAMLRFQKGAVKIMGRLEF